jgi:alanine-glyoxylate transaminase/serine-glyoxylate transaminase/serine-pyruvate transaminase
MINQGVHHLHIPGPSPVPERVLSAMHRQVIDHRGPEFARLGQAILEGLKPLFGTSGPVIVYPSSGTGAWEAAIANTLAPGDRVLMAETGHFATLWRNMAVRLGIEVEFLPGDWRNGADPLTIEGKLAADKSIKAVMVVHNETSTGVTSRIGEIRKAMDHVRHPALLMVDAISSLASVPFQQDAWGVDVAVSCSQKGLMLPPGLGLVAVSPKALAAARTGGSRRSYWDWAEMLASNGRGYFPYTPATNLLYGLQEALVMLQEEGLDSVFARHQRLAAATRAAVRGWGLEVLCRNPLEYSPVLTAVMLPQGHDADLFRATALQKFNLSLGSGLSHVAGKVFRIGHLGDCNDLTLMGALCGVEMALAAANVPHRSGGVLAAMQQLDENGAELRLTA